MNHLNYLQELSYLLHKPGISGIPKARVMIALYGLTDHMLNSSSYSSGELPDQLHLMGDLGISVLDEYSDYFYNKRKSNDIITDSIKNLNELYKANKERTIAAANNKKLYNSILNIDEKDIDEIDVVYNTASYGDGDPTDCCNQSGIVPCNEPFTTYVKYSGESFVFNTPLMESGVFEPGVNLEVIKGRSNIFDIYTVASGLGVDGSGTVDHPFSIINFQTIDCSTGLLDPTINTDGLYTSNGLMIITPNLESQLTQLKYTCHDGEEALKSGDTETHIHGTGENINVRHERGKIKVSDPFTAHVLPVRPEYIIQSGTHDHIPSKFWDFDEDIPCKYGGLSKIKAFTNQKAYCFDQSNFVFEVEGWLGAQQFNPNLPDVVSTLEFRESILYPTLNTSQIMRGQPNKFLHSSHLQGSDTNFTLQIGQNADPDLRIYDSRGDVDHTILSTRWPAERVNLRIRPNYLTLPDVQCPATEEELQKEVYVVDDYGSPLCYPTGFTSFRNISLVDVRTNAYVVENTTQADNFSALTSMYSKTLTPLDGIYLDENYNPLLVNENGGRFGRGNITARARAGLKTYEFYYANLVVENREWDANAGHAYLQTNISVNSNTGNFFITDVAEISRNDYEIGSVDWYMGSSIPAGGSSVFEARGGISIFNPFIHRCPGDPDTQEGRAAIAECYRRISQEPGYDLCNGDSIGGFVENDIMTFLPYDLNLPPGTKLSDFIQPGYLVEGPYIIPGTYVVSISECECTASYGYGYGDCLDCCGPVVTLSRAFIFSDYSSSSQFPNTNYFPYRFRDPAGLTTQSVNINYFVRSNKAVLYNYAVYVSSPPPPGPVTVFTAFEYFEVWLSLFSSPPPVIYPKYKIPSLIPTQSYGFTNFTFSNWNECYRPVSLSAYESKVSQAGAGVSSSTYLAYYGYSRLGCQGLLPFYDLTAINGGLCPDELDPYCVLCASGGGYNNPYGIAPCLAEDVLDYENNSFYNLPVIESQQVTGSVYDGHTVQVLGFVVIVELNFAPGFGLSGNVTVTGNPSVQVNLFPGGDTVTVPYTPGESTSQLLRFQISLTGSDLYDGGTIVVDSNSEIVLSGGSILDETGSTVLLQEGTIIGSRYGPAFDTSGDSTGHEGNSTFPSGAVPDPIRRFPKGDLGNSAGGVGDAVEQQYYGYIDPVSDIVNNHNRTHRPKDVGGYDLPNFQPFYTVHPKSREINAPSSSELFRVYSSDGYASFLVGMIGEVGLIEHKYYTPPCRVGGTDGPWSDPVTPEESEALEICMSEIVPLSLGTLHFETKLNNLHINVSQNHDPLGSGSYPDSWTRKYMENPVNYTGLGVLKPPTGFTVIKNDLILQHRSSSMSYDEAAGSTNMGLLSNMLSIEENAGEYVVDKRVKHSNTNVQTILGGEITDWYCYQLPEKIISDNGCGNSYFGPLSYDRLLLGDPYEDYLSIYQDKCCKTRGCSCADGRYNAFGIHDQYTVIGAAGRPGNESTQALLHFQTKDRFCYESKTQWSYNIFINGPVIDDRTYGNGSPILPASNVNYSMDQLIDQSNAFQVFPASGESCCEFPASTPCPIMQTYIDIGSTFGNAIPGCINAYDAQTGRHVKYNLNDPDAPNGVGTTGKSQSTGGQQGDVQYYFDKDIDGYGSTLYVRAGYGIIYQFPELSPNGFGSPGRWYVADNCANTDIVPGPGVPGTSGPYSAIEIPYDTYDVFQYTPWLAVDCDSVDSKSNQFVLDAPDGAWSVTVNIGGDCKVGFLNSSANCLMGDKKIYP